MTSFNRYLVWLSGLVILGFFWLALSQPSLTYWAAGLSLVFTFLVLWQLTGREFKKRQFWIFLITPILFLASAWVFLLFVEGRTLRYLYVLVFSGLLLIFFKVIFLYLYRRPKYQPHALENVSNFLNVLTCFLFFAGLFNLKIFFGLSLGLVFLAALFVVILLIYQLLSVSNVNLADMRLATFVLTLIIIETFSAVTFLPTSVYVNSLVVTLVYYLAVGLTRNWLLEIKEKRVVARYLIISIISLLIILFSAKWI